MKKRVTKNRLLKMINECLERLETGLVATSINKSRFRPQEYEAGAYIWRAEVTYSDNTPTPYPLYILCFLPFNEFQGCVDGTDILTLRRTGNGYVLSDYEIWYQKK